MKKQERRIFLFTLGLCLFLFLTAAGIVTVDVRGRRLSFGDDTPAFRTVDAAGDRTMLEIRLLGHEGSWDVTEIDKFWKFLLDFGCIPHS